MQLPEKKYIASFDIDAQNTFTPVCPDELPVAEGDTVNLDYSGSVDGVKFAGGTAQPLCALDQRRRACSAHSHQRLS